MASFSGTRARTMFGDSAAAEIVEEAPVDAGRVTGGLPDPTEVAQPPAVAVEHMRAGRHPLRPPVLHKGEKVASQDQGPRLLVFRLLRGQRDDAALVVECDPAPLQADYFAPSPARQIREGHRVGDVGRKLSADGVELSWLEEALPHVVGLVEHGDGRLPH